MNFLHWLRIGRKQKERHSPRSEAGRGGAGRGGGEAGRVRIDNLEHIISKAELGNMFGRLRQGDHF